ncbi:MAG: histidine phosphatase family protein [Thermomicrobiales bacterium]
MLEIRRHSRTKKGSSKGAGSHLSQAGVDLARSIVSGPFDRVVASTIPRTSETAIAMGYAVDETIENLCPADPNLYAEVGHQERWQWERPFEAFAKLVAAGGATAELGRLQTDIWKRILTELPDGGSALIISHGRVIESGLVSLIQSGDYASWGSPFHHCEGIRITQLDGGAFTHEFLRIGRSEFPQQP